MTKFKDLSLEYQSVKVYLLSLLTSLLFYYPFDKLYVLIFKPAMFGGNLYFPTPDFIETIINGALFAFYFFLPLVVFGLIKRKQ